MSNSEENVSVVLNGPMPLSKALPHAPVDVRHHMDRDDFKELARLIQTTADATVKQFIKDETEFLRRRLKFEILEELLTSELKDRVKEAIDDRVYVLVGVKEGPPQPTQSAR